MLGVKTKNEVLHEKIRYTEDGKYELLPTTNVTHPKFDTLVDLVEFYLKPQTDVPYCLAVANPIYDNHHLAQNNKYTIVSDINAPSLPLKDKEIENVTNLVRHGVINNDIYTNTQEAKKALSERLNYNEAKLKFIDPNYLLTGDDCN
jgi:hypothetical protein